MKLLIRTAFGLVVLSLLINSGGGGARATQSASTGRSFVYTIANPDGPNTIAAYARNPETGELIFLDVYPTGGRGNGTIHGVALERCVDVRTAEPLA